jgi:hypothetical protein
MSQHFRYLPYNNSFILLTLFVIVIFFNSCIITNTPGFYSGYKKLTTKQKQSIIILKNNDSLLQFNNLNIYAITANQLTTIIKAKAPCIIYFWSSNCEGTVCIPIKSFQNYCKVNDYQSIIISEYFDFESLDAQGVKYNEIFAINNLAYKTDYCKAYVRRFQKELFLNFNIEYKYKSLNKFLYFDGKKMTNNKPANLIKYPWQ